MKTKKRKHMWMQFKKKKKKGLSPNNRTENSNNKRLLND